MRNRNLLLIILQVISVVFFLSCNDMQHHTKFDKNKWQEQTDPLFPSPYRSQMVEDLTTNHKLVGLKYSQLIELLGIPDYKDSSSLSYKIIVDHGKDIDPVYTKDLEFTFSNDSTVTAFKINEWKKGQ